MGVFHFFILFKKVPFKRGAFLFIRNGHFSLAVMVICLVITLVKPDLPEMANLALLFSLIGGFFCMVLFYSGRFFFIQMDK